MMKALFYNVLAKYITRMFSFIVTWFLWVEFHLLGVVMKVFIIGEPILSKIRTFAFRRRMNYLLRDLPIIFRESRELSVDEFNRLKERQQDSDNETRP